ncbi:MAG: cell division protein ZapA [Bacteroidia bacterium]
MGEKSVKINIAGRVYPLKVNEQEEAVVLDAAGKINERVSRLEATFSVKDKQDLLAMTALQFAKQYLDQKSESDSSQDNLMAALLETEQLIDAHLLNNSAKTV